MEEKEESSLLRSINFFAKKKQDEHEKTCEAVCKEIAKSIAKGDKKFIVIDRIARTDYTGAAYLAKVTTSDQSAIVEFGDLSSKDKGEWYLEAARCYSEYERVKRFIDEC